MHPDTINTLSGPDFLEAVADAEAANGLDINASTYRTRAQQWRNDHIEKQRLATALEEATLALANTSRSRNHPPLPRHAITPSGSR